MEKIITCFKAEVVDTENNCVVAETSAETMEHVAAWWEHYRQLNKVKLRIHEKKRMEVHPDPKMAPVIPKKKWWQFG